MRQLAESRQSKYRCKNARCSDGVTSTKSHPRSKRDETQPRTVTLEFADVMCAPEHHASTLRTRALRSVNNRMMSKCRTRQLQSCDTLSAFFHAWLERGVGVKPPKDPRLSDGLCQHPVKALPLLSPGVSSQWLPGSALVVTDAKCVENLAQLSVVRGLQPSSRACGRGQRGVAEASTAAEAKVHREFTEIVSYIGPDRFDLQFATKELAQDMQTSSMLSTLRLGRFVWYLVGAADVSPFFAYSDEPGTMSVCSDAHWSGHEMTCRAVSAGAVQLESREIEAWSMIQQMVLLSSAESESYAVDAPNLDRRETLGRRRKQDRRTGVNPETRAEDVAE